jgi:DNA topoisomerase-1
MEELGIGRPSTYASILQVLKDRGYVRIDKKRLWPEDKGRCSAASSKAFRALCRIRLHRRPRRAADRISNNEMAWRGLLRDWRVSPPPSATSRNCASRR